MPDELIHLLGQNDLVLLGFAAALGAMAAVAALSLFDRSQVTHGARADLWLILAALSMGFGIWAVHFLALLAFVPGTQSAYAVLPIVGSLLVAIVFSRLALRLALRHGGRSRAASGGALLGFGMALAQFVGMTSLHVSGQVDWAVVPVVATMLAGAVMASLALWASQSSLPWARVLGASLLGLAPSAIHVVAMGALTIVPDPQVALPPGLLPPERLAELVATVTLGLAIASVLCTLLDLRYRSRKQRESELKAMADAAVEGLLVCDGDAIVSVNSSLVRLTGLRTSEMVGKHLSAFVLAADARVQLRSHRDAIVETEWLLNDGTPIPVEIIAHAIDFAGRPHLAYAVRDLRDRLQAEQRIMFLGQYDGLTGLANRSSFHARLDTEIEAARRAGQTLAVLSLDLDRFKEVNDLFGHIAGDDMLRAVATRLAAAVGTGGYLARLGDDEFSIIVSLPTGSTLAGEVAEAVVDCLRTNQTENPQTKLVGCSIGIAVYPDDGADRELLLNNAATALCRAKTEGGGTYRFFEAALGAQVRERRQIEHDLRVSVEREELYPVYQPQVLVESGECIGFEALLRWRRPDRGEISPALFIPIAEESGSIMQIGEWVLRTVCQQAAVWPIPLRVGVNVSAMQLHSQAFPAMVREVLLKSGLEAGRLELEVTETALVSDFEHALATLKQLKDLGVRISMDDFGTGYSSLSYLRAFPFDRIKIDRSFVTSIDRNPQSAAIVRAVIGLGRGLNLPILAEGVETEAERLFLRQEQCQEAQGYLYGRPAAIGSFDIMARAAAMLQPAAA